MYTVYSLYSAKYEKIYIGYSSDFEDRLHSHNVKATKGWTVKYRPWEVVFTEEFASKKDAMNREKQLKSAKGREYVWKKVREKFKKR